ncbi:hypothetical protein LZ32DRAFT_345791 [Colletotrichum eremochloae]|nr:hypothetical protein LZ32DRAFT_345791 [Colletotrichum eremochloae]
MEVNLSGLGMLQRCLKAERPVLLTPLEGRYCVWFGFRASQLTQAGIQREHWSNCAVPRVLSPFMRLLEFSREPNSLPFGDRVQGNSTSPSDAIKCRSGSHFPRTLDHIQLAAHAAARRSSISRPERFSKIDAALVSALVNSCSCQHTTTKVFILRSSTLYKAPGLGRGLFRYTHLC